MKYFMMRVCPLTILLMAFPTVVYATSGTNAISFSKPGVQHYGGSNLGLSATSISGLPVTFTSSNTNVAIIPDSTVLLFKTTMGNFQMALFNSNTPATVDNLLRYGGYYQTMLIHRSVPGFVIQTGGYNLVSNSITPIPTFGAIASEAGISNIRGTVAMALSTGPNSATSQWFVNLTDNPFLDNTSDGGPFTVFGQIDSNGMGVFDAIAGLPLIPTNYFGPPLDQMPLQGLTNGQTVLYLNNLVQIRAMSILTPSTNVMIMGTGTTTITAYQTGDTNFSAATPVTQTLVVNPASQTIAFVPLVSRVYGNPLFSISASTSSGLPIAFTSSSPMVATVSGNRITIRGVGSATITASQSGNGNYAAAPPVSQTLIVSKAIQHINFSSPTRLNYFPNKPFSLVAWTTSGLPVKFLSSNPSVITVSGSTATIRRKGGALITAYQNGNNNYNPANSVRRMIIVQ